MTKPDLLRSTLPVFERVRSEPQRVPQYLLVNLMLFWFWTLVSLLTEELIAAASGFGRTLTQHLFLTLIPIAVCIFHCTVAERRSLRSMGLRRGAFLRDYLTGALAGFLMFSAVLLLCMLGGAVKFCGVSASVPAGGMLLLILGWMIQGLSEEICFRGYLMMTLGTHAPPGAAILASALCFAAAHLGNDGISVPAFLNLMLYGVVCGLYFLRTDSIWGCAALHSAWNFAQGNFFGLPVSGIDSGISVLRCSLTGSRGMLSGGDFGLEGGLPTTLLLTAVIAVLLILPQRKPDS